MSNTIKIYDYTNNSVAETIELGDKVFNSIRPLVIDSISKEEKIIIDFSGITALTTKFLNNAIGKLFLEIDNEKLLNLMAFTGLDSAKNVTLRWSLDISLAEANALSKISNDSSAVEQQDTSDYN